MIAYTVDGMTCDGCARAVTRAIEAALPGVTVRVDRTERRVEIDGAPIDERALRRALDDAGFSLRGPA
jgi:copper chaperone